MDYWWYIFLMTLPWLLMLRNQGNRENFRIYSKVAFIAAAAEMLVSLYIWYLSVQVLAGRERLASPDFTLTIPMKELVIQAWMRDALAFQIQCVAIFLVGIILRMKTRERMPQHSY